MRNKIEMKNASIVQKNKTRASFESMKLEQLILDGAFSFLRMCMHALYLEVCKRLSNDKLVDCLTTNFVLVGYKCC